MKTPRASACARCDFLKGAFRQRAVRFLAVRFVLCLGMGRLASTRILTLTITTTVTQILAFSRTLTPLKPTQVCFLVLDEADRMLSMDFEEELNKILASLPANSSGGGARCTYLFSATMTSKVRLRAHASPQPPPFRTAVCTACAWVFSLRILPTLLCFSRTLPHQPINLPP